MPVSIARILPRSALPAKRDTTRKYSRNLRLFYRGSAAALLILLGCQTLANVVAEGDTRTISFRHSHTGEELTVTYKVNGRYDEEALAQINRELRDWREDKVITMDPHVIDLLWDVHRELNAKEPFVIICGYRSPNTNSMLRKRSKGVAKFSQHMLGKAIDFYIPGVPLESLRDVGLRAQRGGVGFYPSSNFVHLDTGNVRHWGPHIPDVQMAKIMAKGPLTRVAGTDHPVKTALKLPGTIAKFLRGGRNHDEDDDGETAASVAQPGSAAPTRPAVAEARTAPKPAVVAAAPVPTPRIRPAVKVAAAVPAPVKPASFEVASANSRQVELPRQPDFRSTELRPSEPRPAQAASLLGRADSANSIINERGFWQGLSETEQAQASAILKLRSAERRPTGTAIAAAGAAAFGGLSPWPKGEQPQAGGALAYAPANERSAPSSAPATTASIPTRVASASATAPSSPARASAPAPAPVRPMVVEPDTTVAVKRSGARPTLVSSWSPIPSISSPVGTIHVKPGEVANNPWMRAMVLAPNAQRYMSASMFGEPDVQNIGGLMQKPQAAVMMTFSPDPYLGLTTDSFSGYAVVFVSTVTFNQRTASLQ